MTMMVIVVFAINFIIIVNKPVMPKGHFFYKYLYKNFKKYKKKNIRIILAVMTNMKTVHRL